MLGRSANGIFWMFRYLERAENTARLLEAGFHMALTRGSEGAQDEWRSILNTTGQDAQYYATHDKITGHQVANYILCDKENPASVLQMIDNARTNARSVRTAITREVWEATNECWMVMHELLSKPIKESNLTEVLGVIRDHTTLVRGAKDGTMLRNDIFNFARMGTFVERADNTARILDIKYYVLLPSIAWVGSSLDNAQWEMVLRSVAGARAYRWLNAGNIEPRGIAKFLLLDRRFPRSLAFSYDKLRSNMASLARQYGTTVPSGTLIEKAHDQLTQANMDRIFDTGLHEFIVDFIRHNQQIADAISADFRFVE